MLLQNIAEWRVEKKVYFQDLTEGPAVTVHKYYQGLEGSESSWHFKDSQWDAENI